MAGTTRSLLLVVLLIAVVPASTAKDYTVGESSGWTTGVDYSAWTKGKTFHAGDTLSFHYVAGHSVMEVSAADHGACSTSNPLRSHTGQSTTIQLANPGTRYFICGTSGHCASGMKLAVTVSGSRSSSAPATSSSTVLSAKPSKPTGNDEPASGSETASAADTTAAPGSSSKLSSNTSDAAGSGVRLVTVLLLVAVGLSRLVW